MVFDDPFVRISFPLNIVVGIVARLFHQIVTLALEDR